jgi:hypothetical protein
LGSNVGKLESLEYFELGLKSKYLYYLFKWNKSSYDFGLGKEHWIIDITHQSNFANEVEMFWAISKRNLNHDNRRVNQITTEAADWFMLLP